MATDRFAAIRRNASDRPASEYDVVLEEVLLPGVTPGQVTEKPQISAMLPVLPVLPVESTEGATWRSRSDHLQAEWNMPEAWADGVAALQVMALPNGATDARWAQIVADATLFATRRHERAIITGWTVADVFGFDPDDDDTSFGLVVSIQGGATLVLDDGTVVVSRGGRQHFFHPGRSRPGVPMIWTINRRRKQQMRSEDDGE